MSIRFGTSISSEEVANPVGFQKKSDAHHPLQIKVKRAQLKTS
jgi:hypothetical protein